MKWLLLLALVVLPCCGGCAARPTARALPTFNPLPSGMKLSIEPDLLSFLSWVQIHATDETVLCLTGDFYDGELKITGFVAPHVAWRSPVASFYNGCTGPREVGSWHPHPPATPWCMFSGPDTRSFTSSNLIVDLLSCGHGEFRYRIRGDTTTRTLEPPPETPTSTEVKYLEGVR